MARPPAWPRCTVAIPFRFAEDPEVPNLEGWNRETRSSRCSEQGLPSKAEASQLEDQASHE